VPGDKCEDCGSTGADHYLGRILLCDRCLDKRVAAQTGFTELPEAPAPVTLTDVEGGHHTLRYRIWRAPTGIEVELQEMEVPAGEGYHRAVLGAHDADVDELVADVRARAETDMSQRFLEPNPNRHGNLLRKDLVEGRLIWNDEGNEVGTPYDVVVDTKTMSWEELGRALEGYEGWRFRVELADRIDDLRPDAAVIALPSESRAGQPAEQARSPRIDVLLEDFLADQRERLAPRTYSNYESIIGLLRSCLNNYGYQHLAEPDQKRFHDTYDSDEEAFVHLFGADELADSIPEFLGYFMIRKVMAGPELLRSAGTVTKKLAKWLRESGYLAEEAAADLLGRGVEATRDLPRAERLSALLYDLARKASVDLDAVDDEDYVEDYLSIERVDSGAIWFERGIGPLKVPKAATDLARPGWSISVVLARVRGAWKLVEAGNVYPD
jgi:hypothetical protein